MIKKKNEAYLIRGFVDRSAAQFELYSYCYSYYKAHHKGVFFINDEWAVEEIFQNSLIKFWEDIENGKIYAEGELVMGKDGKPFTGSILTYFMSIARFKYMEWVKKNPTYADPEEEQIHEIQKIGKIAYDILYGDDDENMVMMNILADVISRMSERCREILTKFYYEEKDLDMILLEIPSIDSKNALKTKKHKCMENLRHTANEIYQRYLNL